MKLAAALLLSSALQGASGYYGVQKDGAGRWHWLAPDGSKFFSKGCGVVIPQDTALKPGARGYDSLSKFGGDKEKWAAETLKRLQRYGFNTVASWSDESLYGKGPAFTHMLALAGYDDDRLVGVWSEAFKAKVEAQALKETARWKDAPGLLGYYFDNELPWYGDKGWPMAQNTPLISKYMALPLGPDKIQAVKALRAHFKDSLRDLEAKTGIRAATWAELEDKPFARGSVDFPTRLQQAFTGLVADQYFKTCREAVLKADPHHLLLGVRFAGAAPDAVVEACGKYCDVISVNQYSKSGVFQTAVFDRIHVLAGGKPLLLTEFSYRAMENRSGDRNIFGADVTVATQKDRASHLETFLGGGLDLPYLIGYHWFQYFDESPQGRSFDGEDSNYGLVDIHDREYEELREAFIKINRGAEKAHARAGHPVAVNAAAPREVTLRTMPGVMGGGVEERRAWLDFKKADAGRLFLWNHPSSTGKAGFYAGELELEADSGIGWGLGWTLPPTADEVKGGGAPALGFSALEIEYRLEEGKKFWVFLDESGVDEPNKISYEGQGGADGEAWESRPLISNGNWQVRRLDLLDFVIRPSWGNQQGNLVIDLQAVRSLGFYFPGGQGQFKPRIRRLEFIR